MQRLLGAGKSVAAAAAGAFTRQHRALSSSSMLFDDTQIQVCIWILVCIVFFLCISQLEAGNVDVFDCYVTCDHLIMVFYVLLDQTE